MAQQVGQPRRSTTLGTSSSIDQPPDHGTSTKAATISGSPMAPRTRWRGTLLLANMLSSIVSGWLTLVLRRARPSGCLLHA